MEQEEIDIDDYPSWLGNDLKSKTSLNLRLL